MKGRVLAVDVGATVIAAEAPDGDRRPLWWQQPVVPSSLSNQYLTAHSGPTGGETRAI